MLNSRIGQPIPRPDSLPKVRGQAIFAADIRLPGMLAAKFLGSPHAHAEIISIDVSRAEALPGVKAVITAADIPASAKFNPASRFHAFLARQFVTFSGQAVAAVAAVDLATAEEAIDLIEVEYRLLPVISTIAQSIKPDAQPVLHAESSAGGGSAAHTQVASGGSKSDAVRSVNVVDDNLFEHGDLAAAFAASDEIIEHTYTVPVVHQGYIEPHAVTAHWDTLSHVTVWECVQGAFAARELVSSTLGIPQADITLISTEVGGGFGGKAEGIFAPVTVMLAKKAGRPVQLVVTRQEELLGSNPAPHSIIRLKTGLKRDGTFMALDAHVLVDAGAYPTGWIMSNIASTLRDDYRFEAWHVHGQELLTNRASSAAYRAPGGPNIAFAIECQVEAMARQIGHDPLTLRQLNLIRQGEPLSNMEPQVEIGGEQVLAALAAHPAWKEPLPARKDENGFLLGRGMALGDWAGGNGPAAAIAKLEPEGRFRIVLGTVDISGSFTSLAQIAAEALGVETHRVIINKANTDAAPFAPMSAGSQTIYAMGAAVKEAAEELRANILHHASKDMGVEPDDLVMDDDGVHLAADPGKRSAFETLYQLGTEWFAEFGPLIGVGSAKQRRRAPGFAATVADVAVDPVTGKVFIRRMTTAIDAGKAINPLSIEGQIQGASAQSASIALWEALSYDEQGQVRNPSLLDYRMPTAVDMPYIECIIVEAPGGDGPFGAKLVGEPPMKPPVAAVANAVADAIGAMVFELPMTPEKVWRAINNRGANQG